MSNRSSVLSGILSKYVQGGHTFAVQQIIKGVTDVDGGVGEDSLLSSLLATPVEEGAPAVSEVLIGGILGASISGRIESRGFVSAEGVSVVDSCPPDSQLEPTIPPLGPFDLYHALDLAEDGNEDPNLVRATTTWRSAVVDGLVDRELLAMEGHQQTAPVRELDLLEVIKDLKGVQRRVDTGMKRVREEELEEQVPHSTIHPHSIGIIPGEPQPPRRRVTTTTTTSSSAPKSSALRILESMTPLPGTTRYVTSFDEVGIDVRGRSASPQEVHSSNGSTITSPSSSQPNWNGRHSTVRRRYAFSAAEDKAILEGVLRFYGTSRFADIFSAYKAVWQPGRTPTSIYDHWRAKLRSKAVDRI